MAAESRCVRNTWHIGKIVTSEHYDHSITIGWVELPRHLNADIRPHLRVKQDHVVLGTAPMRSAKLPTRLRGAAAKYYGCSGTPEHLTDCRTARRIIVYHEHSLSRQA